MVLTITLSLVALGVSSDQREVHVNNLSVKKIKQKDCKKEKYKKKMIELLPECAS